MTHSLDVMEIFGASAVGEGLMTAAMAILSTEGADRRGRGVLAPVVFADVLLTLGCLFGSGDRDGGADAEDAAVIDPAVGVEAPAADFWEDLGEAREVICLCLLPSAWAAAS